MKGKSANSVHQNTNRNNNIASSANSSSTNKRSRKHQSKGSPQSVVVINGSKSKFEDLWDIKEVENGMVKFPSRVLSDLIAKEDIEQIYYIDETPVASGLFATVRTCTHRETGIKYAAKYSTRFRTGVDYSNEVLHEIAMLSLCNSSSKIVHLRDVFQNKHEIILVLEYAPGGDFQHVLDDDMVPFEEDVISYMTQVLQALKYLHDRSVAHLDIKPQNIVLMGRFPNCEIKLCDLEVARVIEEEEEIREIIGTPDYVAPEIISMDPITLASDIWSVGVLAYVLLTGFSPFGGENDQDTLRNIASGVLDFPHELFEGVSDEAKNFIKACLKKDYKSRPSVGELLRSPWLLAVPEPPSPSPLMLKIPTPDPPSEQRRYCQTCRDRSSLERKRYLSKSREALFEKVSANSNLKKSLSKSRERLLDVRLSLSKSSNALCSHSKRIRAQPRSTDLLGSRKCHANLEQIGSQLSSIVGKRKVDGSNNDGNSASDTAPIAIIEPLLEVPEEVESSGAPSNTACKIVKNKSVEKKRNNNGSPLPEVIPEEDCKNKPPTDGTPWRDELAKYTSSAKPLRVAELIDTFDGGSKGNSSPLKVRRGSLQMNLELSKCVLEEEDQEGHKDKSQDKSLNPVNEEDKKNIKLQRRKSASALPPLRRASVVEESDERIRKTNSIKPSSKQTESSRKKQWEYFEIDHPKAISEKKLAQLKAKYSVSNKIHKKTDPTVNVPISKTTVEEDSTIPSNTFLEVFVNPLTSVVSTSTVIKEQKNDRRRYSSPIFEESHLRMNGNIDTKATQQHVFINKSRPRSNSITADLSFLNPVNRMCTGAFSRAFEKYSLATKYPGEDSLLAATSSDNAQNNGNIMFRRKSSPILKTT